MDLSCSEAQGVSRVGLPNAILFARPPSAADSAHPNAAGGWEAQVRHEIWWGDRGGARWWSPLFCGDYSRVELREVDGQRYERGDERQEEHVSGKHDDGILYSP